MASRSEYDKYTTAFSPEGSLYQAEYAFKAVKNSGVTTVAVRTRDAVYVAAQRKVPDSLIKVDTIPNLFDIDGNLGCAVNGRIPDGRLTVSVAREAVAEYKYEYGVDMPVGAFAKRMADEAQVWTQRYGRRIMAVALIIVGMDQDDATGAWAPRLYKADPAGHFAGYFGVATGQKESEALAFLEKKQKQKPFDELSPDEGAQLALAALQQVSGITLKPRDVEVACCRGDKEPALRSFHRIADSQVDQWLTAIAEDDKPVAE